MVAAWAAFVLPLARPSVLAALTIAATTLGLLRIFSVAIAVSSFWKEVGAADAAAAAATAATVEAGL